MRQSRLGVPSLLAVASVAALAIGGLSGFTADALPAGAATTSPCHSITKAQAIAAGFTSASGPTVTPYNDRNVSANATNALGATIDFGPKALVVSCVSPADLKVLSVAAQGTKKPTMTATQYLRYLVRTSGGSMKAQSIGGIPNYVDFGNGKEDGLGSTSTARSVRLDSFVAGRYIILTQTTPAVSTPSQSLKKFAKTIEADLQNR